MTNLVQGNDAVLSFFKEDWVPFLCATDITLALNATLAPTRTKGDGHFKKNTYQSLDWSVTCSGLLKYDDVNFVGWDMLNNQIGFSNILMRATFTDDAGNIRSLQGSCVVQTSGLSISVGALVKNDFTLTGDGVLMLFDGIFPCPSAITAITVTGVGAIDATMHVNYTYTGAVNQVKYKVDGIGDYQYQVADTEITYKSTTGNHSIEIIPICSNTYEGDGLTQSYTVTSGLSCTLGIASITPSVTGNSVTFTIVFSSPPSFGDTFAYSIDGGTNRFYINPLSNGMKLTLNNQTIGAHSITIKPTCANGVPGPVVSSNTAAYTITTRGAMVSVINWANTFDNTNAQLNIYKNGILVVSQSGSVTPGSGSFSALSTDTVKIQLSYFVSGVYKTMELKTSNSTLSTTIDDQTTNSQGATQQYVLTPTSGYTYSIQATVRP